MLQSQNYVPSSDLAPFIRNHFVFRAALPEDMVLIDPLLSETAMLRVILQGDWAAEMSPGTCHRKIRVPWSRTDRASRSTGSHFPRPRTDRARGR